MLNSAMLKVWKKRRPPMKGHVKIKRSSDMFCSMKCVQALNWVLVLEPLAVTEVEETIVLKGLLTFLMADQIV
jgi:hypothetical protein